MADSVNRSRPVRLSTTKAIFPFLASDAVLSLCLHIEYTPISFLESPPGWSYRAILSPRRFAHLCICFSQQTEISPIRSNRTGKLSPSTQPTPSPRGMQDSPLFSPTVDILPAVNPSVTLLCFQIENFELGLSHMYVATQLSCDRRHFIFRQPIAFCMQSHRMATAEPVLRPLI